MALLMLFALIAGAGTALTPCVLPLLPALLASSATGGRRRPIGIVVGLTLTYTLAIVGLASLVDGVGVAGGLARDVAIVVLLAAGLALLWPPLGARVEAAAARLTARVAPGAGAGAQRPGDGFFSGALIGGALGFLWAPCAGPILAAVISVGATEGASLELVLVALSFGIGSAAVLLLVALGGRRVLDRVRRAGRGPTMQRALGAVMALTAIAMAAELDLRFQEALADDAPSFLVNPTRALEDSGAVEDRLADLRGKPRFEASPSPHASGAPTPAADLDALGTAPDFQGEGPWLNSRPLSLAGLRGRVVLVDFWTYTCINCIRTLPYLRAWDERYRSRGLTIVGVHTPEFTFERETANVERAIARQDLLYPVIQDNDYATWNAWGNQYWPAKYMIDARGQVRYVHFGEGGYEETEDAIRALLAEAGREPPPERVRAQAETPSPGLATPETYLGSDRAEGFVGTPPRSGTHTYQGPQGELPDSRFALSGTWRVNGESATAVRDAGLEARFTAAKVFLVLSSRGGRPRRVQVAVDGGRDRTVTVRDQTLYELVSLPRVGSHRLTLDFDAGVSGFAFTFG